MARINLKLVAFILLLIMLIFLAVALQAAPVKISGNNLVYNFCGCGCCDGAEPEVHCLDPRVGQQQLGKIILQHQQSVQTTNCENARCIRPQQYRFCNQQSLRR